MHPNFGKPGWIPQGREHSIEPNHLGEIDFPLDAVFELDEDAVSTERPHIDNVDRHDVTLTAEWTQGFALPREAPIFAQFRPMHIRPFRHKAEYARRKPAAKHSHRLDLDYRSLLAIARVKMWRWVAQGASLRG